MEDFRISNYLARQVASYGQERAEEGAALSPDGGDGGGLGDGSYHFEDEQEAALQSKDAGDGTLDSAEADADKKSQDEDTALFAMNKLERMRALNEPEEAESELLRQRGRHYYSSAPRWMDLKALPALEPKADHKE